MSWQRYHCPHGSLSQYEADEKCQPCKNRATTLEQGALRACSDCESYTPLSAMVEKADGRVICKACQVKVERITADRAQATLFDNQLTMF